MGQDAARSQYETPTPVSSIGPPPQDPGISRHPDTGMEVAWVALAAVLMVSAGVLLRPLVRRAR